MSYKKIDLRVKILSYLNHKNELEYYPACGFPLEVFIINENSKIKIFTTELLNSSNFSFYSNSKNINAVPISLKKMLFIGNYTLYDHFSWENNLISIEKSIKLITTTIYLSNYLDTKVIHLQNNKINCYIRSLSDTFSNAIWLERENSEMFCVFYKNLKDTRKLLLDYSNNRGVMLKNYNNINFSSYYKNYYGVNYL